jgi:hypothetical protein
MHLGAKQTAREDRIQVEYSSAPKKAGLECLGEIAHRARQGKKTSQRRTERLARLFHTPPVPRPSNQQRFPEAQAIERHWGSRESTGDHSLNEGGRVRLSSPVHSVATQSFREHVVPEHLGPTHPEHRGKKKLHSENWERSPMDPSCSHPKCLASDMASER